MRSIALSLAFLVALAPILNATPEFLGILSSKESGTQFAVLSESGSSPRWAKIGDHVGEYILSAFNVEDEALVFQKDGREFSVRLKASKVQQTNFRGRALPFDAAKQLIASDPEWRSEVSYHVFRQKDGTWHLSASRRAGRAIQLRFLPLIPESIPSDMRRPEQ